MKKFTSFEILFKLGPFFLNLLSQFRMSIGIKTEKLVNKSMRIKDF